MAIYPPNTTPPQRGLNYVWNFLGSSLKTLATALQPYLGGGLPYKSYVAKFSQTGANDPVVTVLYNDTGITVSWERQGVGTYVGNFSQNVLGSKVVIPGSFSYEGSSTMLMTLGNPTVQGSMMYYDLTGGGITIGLEIDTYDTMGASEEYSNLVGNSVFNVEFRIYN